MCVVRKKHYETRWVLRLVQPVEYEGFMTCGSNSCQPVWWERLLYTSLSHQYSALEVPQKYFRNLKLLCFVIFPSLTKLSFSQPMLFLLFLFLFSPLSSGVGQDNGVAVWRLSCCLRSTHHTKWIISYISTVSHLCLCKSMCVHVILSLVTKLHSWTGNLYQNEWALL